MSNESELATIIRETLSHKKLLHTMKGQLRSEIFKVIQGEPCPDAPPPDDQNVFINELIREYLVFNCYTQTESMLRYESNSGKESFSKEFMCDQLKLENVANIPTLYLVLGKMMTECGGNSFLRGATSSRSTRPGGSTYPENPSVSSRFDRDPAPSDNADEVRQLHNPKHRHQPTSHEQTRAASALYGNHGNGYTASSPPVCTLLTGAHVSPPPAAGVDNLGGHQPGRLQHLPEQRLRANTGSCSAASMTHRQVISPRYLDAEDSFTELTSSSSTSAARKAQTAPPPQPAAASRSTRSIPTSRDNRSTATERNRSTMTADRPPAQLITSTSIGHRPASSSSTTKDQNSSRRDGHVGSTSKTHTTTSPTATATATTASTTGDDDEYSSYSHSRSSAAPAHPSHSNYTSHTVNDVSSRRGRPPTATATSSSPTALTTSMTTSAPSGGGGGGHQAAPVSWTSQPASSPPCTLIHLQRVMPRVADDDITLNDDRSRSDGDDVTPSSYVRSSDSESREEFSSMTEY